MFSKSFGVLLSLTCAFLAIGGGFFAEAKTASEWEGRRIYQILTDRFALPTKSSKSPLGLANLDNNTDCSDLNDYCGGTFSGAEAHLDYITGMGFNAIWISPVPVNYKGGYHGYWAIDFTKINPHFGTEAQLKAFIDAAHAKGMWVMMDIVLNHVGPVGEDFSTIVPFNSSQYYHKKCEVTQYVCETTEVQHCRLADLPDLNQDVAFVAAALQKYVTWLVSLGFDGARADTVMYIKNAYWAQVQAAVSTFITGEVWSDFACNLNYTQYGIDSTLNYPLFYSIRDVFQNNQSMRGLGTAWRQMKQYGHPDWEVNFLDNQDNSRFLNATNNTAAYRSALAHMFFTNGIPCIYYGTEQEFSGNIDGNYNREALWRSNYNTSTRMYTFLKNLSHAHEMLKPWESDVHEVWQDHDFYCFVRSPMMICTTTTSGKAQTRKIPNLTWFVGETICNWMDRSAPCLNGKETMDVTIPAGGEPLILYIKDRFIPPQQING